MIESKKLTKDNTVIVNGIDYVGDTGYFYKILNYQDVIVPKPVSKLITPCNLASLKYFGDTLNSLYYLKSNLVDLSNNIKVGKAKEAIYYGLLDVLIQQTQT